MKTAEECLKTIELKFAPHPFGFNRSQRELIKSIIRGIQKEAYNQALEDAIENATLSLFDWTNDGFKEFNQNSNHYLINDGTYVEIDEQSILKLKK